MRRTHDDLENGVRPDWSEGSGVARAADRTLAKGMIKEKGMKMPFSSLKFLPGGGGGGTPSGFFLSTMELIA